MSVTFPAAIGKGIADEAKAMGFDVVELDAQFNADKQVNDVQDLISQKVDGILLIPVDAGLSTRLVDAAVKAGIPIASVHGQVGADRPLADVYKGLDFLYIEDEVAAGATAGKIAVDQMPAGGKVAIIEGQAGFAEVQLRAQDFKTTLEKTGKFEFVANQPGDWTAEKAQAACQGILAAQPDIALFYAQSDDMGVGCSKAVKAANSAAKVIGVGGSKTGIEAVANGDMLGTVCYKPFSSGQEAVKLFAKVLEGTWTEPGKLITYDTPGITKANVDSCTPQW
ncbi:sugar ABC transporter substrate-binding protein [Nakamurella antarctica]|uniref:sugar ABC transporter substrate-binding protein n=1 Tax=Nakamurella antarctica TaxID=1902245 RepID=UPI0013DE07D1|nr:sugar ABC transporter substrate-binding protein [Nakamurella antarctica]